MRLREEENQSGAVRSLQERVKEIKQLEEYYYKNGWPEEMPKKAQ